MPKYDAEKLLIDLAGIVTGNLNAKIDVINTEKNDSVTLKHLDTTKVFFQDLNTENVAADLFLFYGLEDPQAEGLGPYTASRFEIFFILAVADTGENGSAYMTRLLRYMRAMKEIFEDNYSTIPQAGRLRISSLSPVPLNALGNGPYGATGVRIKADLT